MKKIVLFLILMILSIIFGCIKQKSRFIEPELVPQNYEANATRLAEYYYSKHMANVLERSEKYAIDKDSRGRNSEKKYSRLIVADLRLQIAGSEQFTERRNQVLCIENYALRDKTGFNPFDFIMVSKYKYEYGLNNVIAYQVIDGDPNNIKESDRRTFGTDESNAFLQNSARLYSIVKPMQNLSGKEYSKLFEAIRTKYVFGERTEFLLRSIKLIDLIGMETETTIPAFFAEVETEDNKRMLFLFSFPPKDVILKMEKGKTYNNVVVTINEAIFTRKEGNFENFGVVNYVRGLEYLKSEQAPAAQAEQTPQETNR